jgi:hypothetical protein
VSAPVRFIRRWQIVAVYDVPPRDDSKSGSGSTREVTLGSREVEIQPGDVHHVVRDVLGVNQAGMQIDCQRDRVVASVAREGGS